MKFIKSIENPSKGVVMIPRKNAKKLLNMLDSKQYGINTIFFEPFCGTGNITCELILKQLKACQRDYEKDNRTPIDKLGNISALNTIQNLYAIDINKNFIDICRQRALFTIIRYLKKLKSQNKAILYKDFIVFLQHGLKYHIQENEMLSCLKENKEDAEKESKKTRLSYEWFKKNEHRPINFKKSFTDDIIYMNTLKFKNELKGD